MRARSKRVLVVVSALVAAFVVNGKPKRASAECYASGCVWRCDMYTVIALCETSGPGCDQHMSCNYQPLACEPPSVGYSCWGDVE